MPVTPPQPRHPPPPHTQHRKVAGIDGVEGAIGIDDSADFAPSSGFCLWGTARAPRNVSAGTTRDPRKFALIEKGIQNFVDSLPRAEADSGEVMFMLDASAASHPRERLRLVALLTGTCYSPKVCDLTLCHFRDEGDASAATLPFPFHVRVARRNNKVSDNFECMDMRTSSEFAAFATEALGEMRLHKLEYAIDRGIDGSLLWSKVLGATDLGCFWSGGRSAPWGAHEAKQAPERNLQRSEGFFNLMDSSNPLAATSTSTPRATTATKRKAPGQATSELRPPAVRHRGLGGTSEPANSREALRDQPGCMGSASNAFVVASSALEEAEMDAAEHDQDDLDEDDIRELSANFGMASAGDEASAPRAIVSDLMGCVDESLVPESVCRDTATAVAQELAAMADDLGLGDSLGVQPGANSSSSGAAPPGDAPDAVPAPPQAP